MFRLQNHVPPIYVEQSRDFQLLCRLIDCSQGAIKYDIDSMVAILDASTIRDTLLQLLCTKVGFFPKRSIDADILKYIVAAFPYIMKYKGTKRGIEMAVWAIMKAEFTGGSQEPPLVTVYQSSNGACGSHTIVITTTLSDYSRQALEEVLYYIKPIGYDYIINQGTLINMGGKIDFNVGFQDTLHTLTIYNSEAAKISDRNKPTTQSETAIDPQYLGYGQVIRGITSGDDAEFPPESREDGK